MSTPEERIELAFRLAKEVAADPDRFPDDFIVLPLEPGMIGHLLTDERIRLLRTLREHGPYESVTALAEAVDRDQGRVSRDLHALSEYGLVLLERTGKSKRVEASNRPIILA